jgi:pilus assembly protein CpaC
LVITGRVASASEAAQVAGIVASYAPKDGNIENRLTLTSSVQVGLRVRIVEMSRTLTRDLGLNWQTIGALGSFATTPGIVDAAVGSLKLGSTDINGVLDALSEDNLVRTLAEPNLVTQSGDTASFLAGGQFPVPTAQGNGGISVTYQSYGVQLSFVPTVMADNDIILHVHPEVSDISTANSISVSSGTGASSTTNASVVIPGLTVRRADTTVELGSGQSFAIAGLLQDNVNHSVSAFPFLGDVPVLGALFRSDSYQRAQTELVIVVTPYIVHPISHPESVMMPDQNYVPPNDVDRFLKLRQEGERLTLPQRRSTSASGFLVE